MRRIVRMFVNDAFGAPRRVRDDMLPNGIERWRLEGTEPPRQKVLALGSAVWNGALLPVVDLELDRLERLIVSTGPSKRLIEGRVWVGGLTGLLRSASQDIGPGDKVDAGAVLDAAGDLAELLEEVAGTGAEPIGEGSAAIKKISDAITRVRSAAARVNDTRRSTRDALVDFGRVTPAHHQLGAGLNEQADAFWKNGGKLPVGWRPSTPGAAAALGFGSRQTSDWNRAQMTNAQLNEQAQAFYANGGRLPPGWRPSA